MTLRIGVSACLLGTRCNFDGRDLLNPFVKNLVQNNKIEFVPFCPEDSVFGTPRPNLRIVGGDGFDVLTGSKATVVDENGHDVTLKQIEGARRFLNRLTFLKVKCAILMDGSPSCGSNVLLQEKDWPRGGFKKGVGVAAALLKTNGIVVFGSFDELAVSEFLKSSMDYIEFPGGLKNLRDLPKFKNLFS